MIRIVSDRPPDMVNIPVTVLLYNDSKNETVMNCGEVAVTVAEGTEMDNVTDRIFDFLSRKVIIGGIALPKVFLVPRFC